MQDPICEIRYTDRIEKVKKGVSVYEKTKDWCIGAWGR